MADFLARYRGLTMLEHSTDGEEAEGITPALSRHVASALAKYTGRGPNRVRVRVASDCITVLTEGVLTRSEQLLVEHEKTEAAQVSRDAFQDVLEQELVAGVERLTGRSVITLLSAHDVEADLASDVFVLAPAEGPSGTD
ncbi:MAG: Na-translocating system protein MpsC family protein [Patulibacter minatonensis]